MAHTGTTYTTAITAAISGGLALVQADPGVGDEAAAAVLAAGQFDLTAFDPAPPTAYIADMPITALPADHTAVRLADSAGNVAWATLVPTVPGLAVATVGADGEWQAVRVFSPDGQVRLYLSAPGVVAPDIGAWIAANQVIVAPDPTVTAAQALGIIPVLPETELQVLEGEMEQKDAGWADPKGARIAAPSVPCSRGWVYLESTNAVPARAKRVVDQAVFSRVPPSSTMTNMVLSAPQGGTDVCYTSRTAHWQSLSRGAANRTTYIGPFWVDSAGRLAGVVYVAKGTSAGADTTVPYIGTDEPDVAAVLGVTPLRRGPRRLPHGAAIVQVLRCPVQPGATDHSYPALGARREHAQAGHSR